MYTVCVTRIITACIRKCEKMRHSSETGTLGRTVYKEFASAEADPVPPRTTAAK